MMDSMRIYENLLLILLLFQRGIDWFMSDDWTLQNEMLLSLWV